MAKAVKSDPPRKPFHEIVAEKLIEQLKQGTAPWQKPWEPGQPAAVFPMNPTTGQRYKGVNAIFLMAQGHADLRWMTYRQAEAVGAQVRKGERGTPIQYWKFDDEAPKIDGQGRPVRNVQGEIETVRVKLERPRVFHATVFNATQIDGLPAVQAPAMEEPRWQVVERAEAILTASGATIRHEDGNRAFYRSATDSIHLPQPAQFASADRYYATALHELGHWSGHASRLGRDLSHPFGSEGYAREELRAEIASLILGDVLGIGHDPGQHAAYVKDWIAVLENDPLEIVRAAADAEKIQRFVLAFEQVRQQDQNQDHEPAQKGAPQTVVSMTVVGSAMGSGTGPLTRAHDVRTAMTPQDAIAPALNLQPRSLDIMATSAPVFLQVTYREKDEVKALGARWDRQAQSWYVPAGVDPAPFTRWTEAAPTATPALGEAHDLASAALPQLKGREDRQYLAVPFEDRHLAKAAGAQWDRVLKSWYVDPQIDHAPLQRWALDPRRAEQAPAVHPRDEFAEAMRDCGLVVEGDHPLMDGQKHRVRVEGGKPGAVDGFYVLFGDGHPAGRIINHKTGIDETWKSKGYVLSPERRAELQAEAAASLERRRAAHAVRHEEAAARVQAQLQTLQHVTGPTPYLGAKGVQVHPGAFTDAAGTTTFIPAIDVDHKVWSMQYIQADGTKRFAKDGHKEGCFHAVGGLEALRQAPAIVIAEGYATAATLCEALGFATVAAFDSGNLMAVARALQGRFPDKPIVIAGDDDQHLVATLGRNPGREKMEAAAQAVGAVAVLPIFAPGEREAQPGVLTDFNDLATRSVLGREGVKRQVRPIVQAAIDRQAAQAQAQAQRRTPTYVSGQHRGRQITDERPESLRRIASM